MAKDSQAENKLSALSRLYSRLLIPAALVVFIAPFIGLLFYATMNTDDYAKATLSYNCAGQPAFRTIAGMAWVIYSQGSARWLTSFLQSIAMSKVDIISAYGWLLLLVMLTNIGALTFFFANFLRVPYSKALVAGGLFYCVWLGSAASPIDGVFWVTEAFEYNLSLSTILVLAGLLSRSKHTIFSYIALAVCAIAIPAQHEVAGTFVVACLFMGVVAARALKLQARDWWFCLGITVISLGAVMLSPAMASKFAQGHKNPEDLAHYLPYARRAVGYGMDWIMNPAVLLCGFCMPLIMRRGEDSTDENGHLPPRWLAPIGLVAMCFLVVLFSVAEMTSGYGTFGPRAIGWTQFVFWLLLVCVIMTGLPELSKISFSPVSKMALLTFFMVSVFASGNFHLAEKDLRGPAAPWWRASVARLREHGGAVRYGPLPPKPALFANTYVSVAPGCWVNQCMAVYVGSETVVTSDPTENPYSCGFDPIATAKSQSQ